MITVMLINMDVLKDKIKFQEGSIDHMYLDTRGLVTIGVGNLIRSDEAATEINFLHRANSAMATNDEIIEEYWTLKEQPVGLKATAYERYTKLIITEQEINRLLGKHIEYFKNGLFEHFNGFDRFPVSAQEALFDMAFNLGLNGLFKKFPKMIRAAQNEKWEICAKECHRNGIGEARNDETRELFEKAYNQNTAEQV